MNTQSMQLAGGVWCQMGDPYFAPRLRATAGLLDRETIAAAMFHVKHRHCAVDCGAHIGTWTRQLAGQFSEVVALEPDPENFGLLRLNTEELGNVRALPLALGAHVGRVGFSHHGAVNSGQGYVTQEKAPIWVVVIQLDVLDLRGVGLLKLDCEGFEVEAIKGADRTIQRERPVIVIEENICAERYGRRPPAARERLKSIGMVEAQRFEFFPGSFDVVMVWPERAS